MKVKWICPIVYLYHNKKQIGKGLTSSIDGKSVMLLEPYNYNTIIAKAKIYVGDGVSKNPKAIGERIYIIKKERNQTYKDIYFNNKRR